MSMDHIHALPSGTLLEEYRLHSVLGAGGFGITYRAEDTHLNKVVAIKEYLPSEFATRTGTRTVVPHSGTQAQDYHWGLTRFLDEARTLARFDHPHLNKVHRYFEANGTAYLVLEYIEGETLGDLLDRRGTLPEVELRRLLAEVLGGLAVVHEAGYVHRDVKPGNLMLRDEDGSAVLLDFGAARQAVGQRSRSVTSILTPGYAPVEQYGMRVEDVGPWSDIYALGMVAYRCVSGLRDGQLPDAVTRSGDQRKGGGDWASTVAVGAGRYAEGLLRAIDWAVAVNEEDRPQGVAQWQAALSGEVDGSAYVQGEGAAEPTSAPVAIPQDSKAGRSPRFAVMLAGVVALTLALVGGGVYWFVQNQPRPDTAEAGLAVEAALELARAERQRVQQGLTAAGFHPGSVDGLFGEGTRSALREWQASQDEVETGYLDAESARTLLALGSEFELWESVKGSDSPEDFEGYLRQYPSGIYADAARSRRQALMAAAEAKAEWELVKDSQNPADFEGYLSQYSDGTHADEAHSRRQALIAADDAAYARAQSTGTVVAYGEYLQSYPAGGHVDKARSRQQEALDDEAYARARSVGTMESLEEYLQGHPAGRHADKARSRRQALIAAAERELWESVKDSQNLADFEGYLSQYPDGTYADEARSRRQALITADDTAYAQARSVGTMASLGAYLRRYPNGVYADEARSWRREALIAADDEAYARARSAGTVTTYGEYLQSYPAGRHADEARRLQTEVKLAELRPGQLFSDELGSGGQGPEMVVLPAGGFRMGCVSGRDCEDNEMPVHEVRIAQPFALSKYEVTRGEFGRFVARAGYRTTAERGRGCYVWDGSEFTEKSSARWDNPGFDQLDTHPVVCVSWDDAVAYVEWLSSETGKRYRLPSEAEWEYAARSGSTTKYHFGDDESQLCWYANHADRSINFSGSNESCSDGIGARTAEVGSYQPNSFGLHDMHGNVFEWVQDCWNDSYAGAPSNGSAWTSGDCGRHVLRGGSWLYAPEILRAAFRGQGVTDNPRGYSFGFRVARTLTP